MSSKITIIGAGSVGSTIAYTLSSQDIASELVLIDINKKKAEGEVLDIIQGTCFRDPISIIAGDYEDAKDSDIVIMVPGLYLYRGFYNLGIMSLSVAASWFASAILIIAALPLGLIFARILTDKAFRYCT